MKSLFVTATDTDIGKTSVCAGIAHSLKKSKKPQKFLKIEFLNLMIWN